MSTFRDTLLRAAIDSGRLSISMIGGDGKPVTPVYAMPKEEPIAAIGQKLVDTYVPHTYADQGDLAFSAYGLPKDATLFQIGEQALEYGDADPETGDLT